MFPCIWLDLVFPLFDYFLSYFFRFVLCIPFPFYFFVYLIYSIPLNNFIFLYHLIHGHVFLYFCILFLFSYIFSFPFMLSSYLFIQCINLFICIFYFLVCFYFFLYFHFLVSYYSLYIIVFIFSLICKHMWIYLVVPVRLHENCFNKLKFSALFPVSIWYKNQLWELKSIIKNIFQCDL